MEKEVKHRLKRNRRRERAERMQAQRDHGDSAEDETLTGVKPPRPPIRRKKLKEPTFEEDIIDGFAILAFRSYEELEVSRPCFLCSCLLFSFIHLFIYLFIRSLGRLSVC